jgi:hypothetical protein
MLSIRLFRSTSRSYPSCVSDPPFLLPRPSSSEGQAWKEVDTEVDAEGRKVILFVAIVQGSERIKQSRMIWFVVGMHERPFLSVKELEVRLLEISKWMYGFEVSERKVLREVEVMYCHLHCYSHSLLLFLKTGSISYVDQAIHVALN